MQTADAVRAMWSRVVRWYRGWPVLCRWIPPLAWMVLIFFVSSQPDLPHAPGPIWDLLLKKAGHAVEYGVLYLLLWQALDPRRPFIALAWMLTVLYAVSDEFHQAFVPGRNGRWMDVVIDSVGASVAALAVWASVRRSR